MINIYYTEKYWGHSQTMNGPQKVVKNLLQSLKDCKIPYAINEEIYDKTLFVHWSNDMLGYYYELKNKKNLLVGPQVWAWSNEFHQLKEYNKVLLPSKWCEDSMNKFFPKLKLVFGLFQYIHQRSKKISKLIVLYILRADQNLI